MACGCGKRKVAPQASPGPMSAPFASAVPMQAGYVMSTLCNQPEMVKVVYRGSRGKHIVPSPLRKVRNYGMHTYGDVFCVHFDDQKTAPTWFELYVEPEPEVPAEPEPEPEPVVEAPVEADGGSGITPVQDATTELGDEEAEEDDEPSEPAKPRRRRSKK